MNMPPENGIFAEIDARDNEKKQEEEAEKRLRNALLTVMNMKQGRQVMAWVLSFTGQDASVTSSDALVMASMSGRRDVGLSILNRLKALCPDAVFLMEKEQNNG